MERRSPSKELANKFKGDWINFEADKREVEKIDKLIKERLHESKSK